MRILYVEDNTADADLTRTQLARRAPQLRLEIVTRIADAWNALAHEGAYDLVLSDLHLPDGSGIELLSGVRQKGMPLAVVILTGSGDEKHAVAALKAGVDDYLVKRGDYLDALPQVLESALAAFREGLARRNQPLRVLYAEHNAPDIEITRHHLARHAAHIRLTAVTGGEEALQLVREQPAGYDVILLDYRLAGGNALDILLQLQAELPAHPPVVVVTGQGDEDLAVAVLRQGAADYLVKRPGYLHELPGTLESAHHRALLSREQAALRASEASRLLREQALGTISQGVLLADAQRRVTYANAAFTALTGYTEKELLGRSCALLQGPETEPATVVAMRAALEAGRSFEGELVNYRKDGSKFWNSLSITPVRDEAGRVINFVGVLQDVTHRKTAEARLQAEKLFSDTLVGSLPGLVFLFREDGRILRWNRHLEAGFEFSHEEVGRMTPFDFIVPEERELARRRIGEALSGRTVQAELTVLSKSGRRIPFFFTASRLELEGETCILGVGLDISERRSLEEQFRQAQKMEAIGRLSGGVAHDFNNLLTVISGNIALLQEDSGLSESMRWNLQEVAQAARRAANLTRQLLTFSRQQNIQLTALDLNAVVGDMARMLSRILGEDIAVRYKYARDILPVTADAGMLEQVLLNLAVNARDAMPEGGELVIETAMLPATQPRPAEAATGPCVRFSVSDTGSGIPPELLPRIFDPFFTTKDVGKGTGLGLATVYGIVQQHRGWVEVTSKVGEGTTFHVYLPRGDQVAARPVETAAPVIMAKGNEMVLLVEDEPAVRMLVHTVLDQAGYRVLEAGSGAEALKFWQEHRGEIRLLLTDYVMPDGMSGRQLAERLLGDEPQLRVIFTSGYSAEIAGAGFDLKEGVNFLSKPFELAKLVSAVRGSLDRPQSRSSFERKD